MRRNQKTSTLIFMGLLAYFLLSNTIFAQGTSSKLLPPKDFIFNSEASGAINLDSLMAAAKLPALIIEDQLTGRVVVQILVDTNGRYVRHIVLRNPHPILTKFVESIIPQIRWKPYRLPDGEQIGVWVTLPFDLRYRN